MWDDRFAGEEYLFGTEPAAFLKSHAGAIPAGSKVLCVADGEGRNSVYLAGLGHHVTAMDGAANGIAKAKKLAGQRGVEVDYHLADIADWEWTEGAFDAVVAVFIQFMGPEMRRQIFDGLTQTLKPGGVLLLHGYTPKQLDYRTGGPPILENLYTAAQLRAELPGIEIETLREYEAEVDEGKGHSGRSALVDLIGHKPG